MKKRFDEMFVMYKPLKEKQYNCRNVTLYQTTNFYAAMMIISVINRVENIVGKGENAGYQHFLLFPQCFQKL